MNKNLDEKICELMHQIDALDTTILISQKVADEAYNNFRELELRLNRLKKTRELYLQSLQTLTRQQNLDSYHEE